MENRSQNSSIQNNSV